MGVKRVFAASLPQARTADRKSILNFVPSLDTLPRQPLIFMLNASNEHHLIT